MSVAALLVLGCAAVGWWLTRHGFHLHLGSTYPVGGQYRLHLSGWLAAPLVVGASIIGWGPGLAVGTSWRRLSLLAFLAAAAWAVTLSIVSGPAAIAAPLTTRYEYLADVSRIRATGIGQFLRTFTDYIIDTGHGPVWVVQVSAHPPLATLLFVLLATAGLGGAGWAATMCIGAGAAAVPAIAATIRLVAGEARARAALPYLVLAPAALWVATSADAIFAGVGTSGVYLLAGAALRPGWRGALRAFAGGLVLGAGLYLSYGLVLLAPVALGAVIAAGHRARTGIGSRPVRATPAWAMPVAVGLLGVATVVAGFTVAGFWWLAGLAAVVVRMKTGGGWLDRPDAYFAFANVADLAILVGPAVVAALPVAWRVLRHRLPAGGGPPGGAASEPAGSGTVAVGADRRELVLPLAALAALAIAMISNLAKGEVERIYLPWALWLVPLAALLPERSTRAWLGAQAGFAFTIAATTALTW